MNKKILPVDELSKKMKDSKKFWEKSLKDGLRKKYNDSLIADYRRNILETESYIFYLNKIQSS